MARPGPKSKLRPELQKEFCALVAEKGLFRRHAAAKVGVDEITVSRWMSRGASETGGLYHEFYLAVLKAEAAFAETAHDTMQASAASNPKLVQFLLSRRFPDLYGRRDNVEEQSAEDKDVKAQQLRETLIERLEKLFPPEEAPAEPSDKPLEASSG